MRAYVITTAVVFAVLLVMHVARLFAEGWDVATNPWFDFTTIAAAGLCLWGLRLLKVSPRS